MSDLPPPDFVFDNMPTGWFTLWCAGCGESIVWDTGAADSYAEDFERLMQETVSDHVFSHPEPGTRDVKCLNLECPDYGRVRRVRLAYLGDGVYSGPGSFVCGKCNYGMVELPIEAVAVVAQ